MKCPHSDCNQEVSDADVREVFPDELYERYTTLALSRAIEQNKDISWCPTPDCKFAFIYQNSKHTDITPGSPDECQNDQLKCPICSVHYCLSCRVVYHTGKTCAEHQEVAKIDENDAKFLQYARGSKFKQCPHCDFWVERTLGCDHMKCRCGKDFCYKCGGIHGDCECRRLQRE